MLRKIVQVKQALKNTIDTICDSSRIFVKNPEKDFTRTRKISFRDVLLLFLCQEGGSLTTEIFRYFKLTVDMATPSAFIQQRDKILPEAFISLFHMFTDKACPQELYQGLRLLAADGSDIHVPTNSDELDSYFPGTKEQSSYNLLHLSALYDLNADVYVDAKVEGRHSYSEVGALCTMVDSSSISNALVIADRGYESYDLMAHIQEKGWFFLIRARESHGIPKGIQLPDSLEFDLPVKRSLTRRLTINKTSGAYPLSFRLIKLRVTDDSYELLLTNLPENAFSLHEIRTLYNLRWGIETSFRALKYTVGLLHFHTKKTENILKEIFARISLYNFSSLVALFSAIPASDRKYPCKVKFSVAVHLCRQFILGSVSPPVLEALLLRHTFPIRTGRSFPRVPSLRKPVSFAYRIA